LRKWLALSGAERRVAVEALLLVAAFSVALRVLPFRVVSARVHLRRRRRTLLSARRMGSLVDRAGQLLHASCLPRAFALARMLASRGIRHELQVGVRRSDSGITAHAWVRGESGWLIGGTETDQYRPLVTLGE
jgi:hypothetical protein